MSTRLPELPVFVQNVQAQSLFVSSDLSIVSDHWALLSVWFKMNGKVATRDHLAAAHQVGGCPGIPGRIRSVRVGGLNRNHRADVPGMRKYLLFNIQSAYGATSSLKTSRLCRIFISGILVRLQYSTTHFSSAESARTPRMMADGVGIDISAFA